MDLRLKNSAVSLMALMIGLSSIAFARPHIDNNDPPQQNLYPDPARPTVIQLGFNTRVNTQQGEQDMQGLCVGTLVGKAPVEDTRYCKFGIATAGHCANADFKSLSMTGIKNPKMISLENGLTENPKIDVALITIQGLCESFQDGDVTPLAPLNSQVKKGDALFSCKRNGSNLCFTANPGRQTQSVDGAAVVFANLKKGDGHEGGDFGAPMYDQAGNWIAPLSGGNIKEESVYSPGSLAWMTSHIANLGMKTESKGGMLMNPNTVATVNGSDYQAAPPLIGHDQGGNQNTNTPVPEEEPDIGPGTRIRGLKHVRRADNGTALVKTTDGEWEKVRRDKKDGHLKLKSGKQIDQQSLEELVLALKDTEEGFGSFYKDRMRDVKAVVAHYRDQIPQFEDRRNARRLRESQEQQNNNGNMHGNGSGNGNGNGNGHGHMQGPKITATWTPPNIQCNQGPYTDADIHGYENKTYIGDLTRRYRFDERVEGGRVMPAGALSCFENIPKGGTGKLILGYFGNRNSQLEAEAAQMSGGLVEAVYYPPGSKEVGHAEGMSQGGTKITALGVDGLGRKITRYTQEPRMALQSLMQTEYPSFLRYICARKQYNQQKTNGGGSSPHDVASVLGNQGTVNAGPVGSMNYNFDSNQMGHFLNQACTRCHGEGKQASPFPSFLSNGKEFEKLLKKRDPIALDWLKRLNSKVVHGEMLTHAGLDKNSGVGKNFKDYIAAFYNANIDADRPREIKIGTREARMVVDPQKKNLYLDLLKNANISDPELKRSLLEFDEVWDHVGSPEWSFAAHDGDSGRYGPKAINHETPPASVQEVLMEKGPEGWMWKEPFRRGFAMDKNTKGLQGFFLIKFPRDAQENLIKGVSGSEQKDAYAYPDQISQLLRNDDNLKHPFFGLPPGTKVVEVFYSAVNGKPVIVDIMSRERRITADGKEAFDSADVARIDSSPQKIQEWLRQADIPKKDKDILTRAIQNPMQDRVVSNLGLANENGGKPFIVNGVRTNTIPASKSVVPANQLNPETIAKMYAEIPLTSAAGSSGWQLELQDIFQDSHRGIAVNNQNCMNCHRFAGETFGDTFRMSDLKDSTGKVAAYGNLPVLLSSPPVYSVETLNSYKNSDKTKPTSINLGPNWSPFFESYDPNKHNPDKYRRIESLPVGTVTNSQGKPVDSLRSKYRKPTL